MSGLAVSSGDDWRNLRSIHSPEADTAPQQPQLPVWLTALNPRRITAWVYELSNGVRFEARGGGWVQQGGRNSEWVYTTTNGPRDFGVAG